VTVWRDLQTEWEPSSFAWVLCRQPEPTSDAAMWCGCMGSVTEEQRAAGLCACEFAARFGVYDRRPILPPARGCKSRIERSNSAGPPLGT
jgi:hypothetical protein